MLGWFQKKPQTVYEAVKRGYDIGEPGQGGLLEYQVLRGEREVFPCNTEALDAAILAYFAGEWASLEKIQNFFKKHLALEAIPNFEHWLYGGDRMDRPMLGLSILLMRDSQVVEAVKFGIYLSIYYDLHQAPGALKIVQILGKDPHFSYYALEAFLRSSQGTVLFYDLGQKLEGLAKDIYEYRARQLFEEKE
ncbi:MAG: hypothetical protein Q4E37_00230 [Tissierellia bacterium]|nr:hypothetical protein [Tissierellia bacterium]